MKTYTLIDGKCHEGVVVKNVGRGAPRVMVGDRTFMYAGTRDFVGLAPDKTTTVTRARLATTIHQNRKFMILVNDWKGLVGGTMLLFSVTVKLPKGHSGPLVRLVKLANCPMRGAHLHAHGQCRLCGEELVDNIPRTNNGKPFRHPDKGLIHESTRAQESMVGWFNIRSREAQNGETIVEGLLSFPNHNPRQSIPGDLVVGYPITSVLDTQTLFSGFRIEYAGGEIPQFRTVPYEEKLVMDTDWYLDGQL
jgi:hypothetical protein